MTSLVSCWGMMMLGDGSKGQSQRSKCLELNMVSVAIYYITRLGRGQGVHIHSKTTYTHPTGYAGVLWPKSAYISKRQLDIYSPVCCRKRLLSCKVFLCFKGKMNKKNDVSWFTILKSLFSTHMWVHPQQTLCMYKVKNNMVSYFAN